MTPWISRQADGAVAHAEFYVEELRAACAGPVCVIPLAYDATGAIPAAESNSDPSQFHVLTFGHINANRRVESVLRALAGSERLRSVARFRVVGLITDEERRRLESTVAELGLTKVEFTGPVSDEALRAEISSADAVCALRQPALEGASASAIETLRSGRPLIVTDAGFYRMLPDELVWKVRPDREVDDLRDRLEAIQFDRQAAMIRAAAAAAWAARIFSAEAYVRKLRPFLEMVVACQPVLRTAESFGRTLARAGLSPGDPAAARVADTLGELFKPADEAKHS